jgi:hypothetical protein
MDSQWYHQQAQVGHGASCAPDALPATARGTLNEPQFSMLGQEGINRPTLYQLKTPQNAEWGSSDMPHNVFDSQRQEPRRQLKSFKKRPFEAIDEGAAIWDAQPEHVHQLETQESGPEMSREMYCHLEEDELEE